MNCHVHVREPPLAQAAGDGVHTVVHDSLSLSATVRHSAFMVASEDLPTRARMPQADLLQRITIRPEQCGGRPCIRGLRTRVIDVLEMLAAGESHQQILADFPYLEADDIAACLLYAARRLDHPNVAA